MGTSRWCILRSCVFDQQLRALSTHRLTSITSTSFDCFPSPTSTRLLLGINIGIYFYTLAVPGTSAYSICTGPVFYLDQYYRILSSAFFHMGLMHIFFNMMSLYSLGGPLERALGTLCFLGVNLAFVVLSNIMYLLGAWLAFKATDDSSWLVYCSVGFSGVLFGLVVLETKLGDATQPRSLFGVCNVPAAAYPWALLILLQILMPGISFIGHLTGLLCGILYVFGFLPWCSLKLAWIQAIEASACVAFPHG
jgi:membrane associated rhomboid family serine protease